MHALPLLLLGATMSLDGTLVAAGAQACAFHGLAAAPGRAVAGAAGTLPTRPGLVRRARCERQPLSLAAAAQRPERLSASSEASTTALPGDKRGSVHFINLSNGVEALPMLEGVPTSFVRIQSSHCEANNFNGILGGLDSTFLMYLAMGHVCYIYDFGSRNKKRKAPRAVWYGITFVKYALHM